jgi:hypothetical protein
MSLPSLDEVALVIVLLVPGFFSLSLFRWLSIDEKKLSDNQLVIWSVFVSLLIYVINGVFTGITDVNLIKDRMLLPTTLLSVLGLSVLFGIVPGLIVKYFFRGNIVRGDPWCAAMKKAAEGAWVNVFTVGGQEYSGYLHYVGGEEECSKEISIREPLLIQRNLKNNNSQEIKMGKEILFTEKDISRIVFDIEV